MGFCGVRVGQNPSLPIGVRKPLHKSKWRGGVETHGNDGGGRSCSVKVKLGKKWKEYQGVGNWEGLLDPLDDNLRKEILRYGQFVDAAYKSFDFDPCSPSYATCIHSQASLLDRSGFPWTGYRVSKHLTATSGIRLPAWVHAHKGPIPNSSWIGYVAVCQDEGEISRLGRRDVVIAFRGTATWLEWLENLRARLTKLPAADDYSSIHSPSTSTSPSPMVESGFLSLYTCSGESCPSLKEMVREEISRVVESYGDQPLSLTITGHSLGAALATLAAYDIKEYLGKGKGKGTPMVTVISFGGPRVGNRSFRKVLENQGTKVLRIVNSDDLITKVPGFLLNDAGGLPGWIHKCVEDTQWAYSDVGRELRLCSRDSPHLSAINFATCHHLNTYLHLVDGFVSSTSPFRSPTPPSNYKSS